MPKINSELQHSLGKTVAIKRMKDSCEWAHGVSNLRATWDDNRMEFTATIQGVTISGQVEVTENTLLFQGTLPLVAIPFKSWIPNILKNALKPRKPLEEHNQKTSAEALILYLHIPKAGGTTLGEFIYGQCKNCDDKSDDLLRNGVFFSTDGFFRASETGLPYQMQSLLTRNDLRAVVGHFSFGIHNLLERPFHYITILREPVSRVVSLYHYLKLEDEMSLQEFADSCPYREIDNDQTRRIAGVNPEIGKCSQNDLQTAKDNLRNHFAVVGTTERFDETLALLKQKFNWSEEVVAYPRNVNTYEKDSTLLSGATVKAITDRNLFDIELHHYANQLMDERIASQGETLLELLQQQKAANNF